MEAFITIHTTSRFWDATSVSEYMWSRGTAFFVVGVCVRDNISDGTCSGYGI